MFFGQSGNSENFFYSLLRKHLCTFAPVPFLRFFVKTAQVRANYRGTVFLELGRTLSKADSFSAASNGSDRNEFRTTNFARLNLFRPVPAELPGDNEVSPAGETRALRTNRIWSKGRVEYASLAETSVISVNSCRKASLREWLTKKP